MSILLNGSDLTLAPTIGPVVQQAAGANGTVRGAVDLLVRHGFRAVQLDASLAGVRPRDLSVRARRDLLGLFTRQGIMLAGVDLFIPRRHFLDGNLVDRAMSATLAAIELAADLGRVALSIALPADGLAEDSRSALVQAADGHGIRLAVHAEDQLDALQKWADSVDLPVLGVGIDPAALLGGGLDPARQVHRLSTRLAVARVSDVSAPTGGGIRCEVGRGELDVTGYRIAVDLARQRSGPVVLDLRGLADPTCGRHRGPAGLG